MQILAIFHKNALSQNHTAGTDICYKNEARKLKFGLDVPLYGF